MLFTITTGATTTASTASTASAASDDGPDHIHAAAPPATDLGFVLHKHPDNIRTVSTAIGPAHVFWTAAEADRASVATLVDVDPIGLVRRGGAQPLAAYVNDRPYIASSFLSVAIGRLFRSAMNGDCPARPELVGHRWPVTVDLPAAPVGADPQLVERLFGPLGYRVDTTVPPLDPSFPEWGPARVGSITLTGWATMVDLLRHLYVLLPVLDNDKHYWIDENEVEKLLRHGEGWLSTHPQHAFITRRYLGNFGGLTAIALDGLSGADSQLGAPEASSARPDAEEARIELPLSLNDQRLQTVTEAVLAARPATVADLGCGEGNLLIHLAEQRSITKLVGADVSLPALNRTERRLRLDQRPERQTPTVELVHSSLTYRDARLVGIDVACLVEVIEHLDPLRLDAVEPILFGEYQPRSVIVTTPNREYNELFDLAPGTFRHRDHRFEWTRAEFAAWCGHICDTYSYLHRLESIGPVDPQRGAPTQMAVFSLSEERSDG